MENLEYLESLKEKKSDKFRNAGLSEGDIELRKMNALEIIAEELINNNSTMRSIVTTLENIETALKQRG